MVERKKDSRKSSNALTGRRLRELAVEATKHLDEVLPGLEKAEAAGNDAGGPKEKQTRTPAAGAHGRSPRRGRAPAKRSGASPTGRVVNESGVSSAAGEASGSKAGSPAKALVAHISPGAARILANLLKHIGLEAQVVDCGSEVKSVLGSEKWDIVFAQGTPMPYPGRRISLAALSHCAELGTPVVLLSRRGENLVPEAAGGSAVGLLEWPFSAEKVIRALSEAIPDHKSS
jgi:hypothetical protein